MSSAPTIKDLTEKDINAIDEACKDKIVKTILKTCTVRFQEVSQRNYVSVYVNDRGQKQLERPPDPSDPESGHWPGWPVVEVGKLSRVQMVAVIRGCLNDHIENYDARYPDTTPLESTERDEGTSTEGDEGESTKNDEGEKARTDEHESTKNNEGAKARKSKPESDNNWNDQWKWRPCVVFAFNGKEMVKLELQKLVFQNGNNRISFLTEKKWDSPAHWKMRYDLTGTKQAKREEMAAREKYNSESRIYFMMQVLLDGEVARRYVTPPGKSDEILKGYPFLWITRKMDYGQVTEKKDSSNLFGINGEDLTERAKRIKSFCNKQLEAMKQQQQLANHDRETLQKEGVENSTFKQWETQANDVHVESRIQMIALVYHVLLKNPDSTCVDDLAENLGKARISKNMVVTFKDTCVTIGIDFSGGNGKLPTISYFPDGKESSGEKLSGEVLVTKKDEIDIEIATKDMYTTDNKWAFKLQVFLDINFVASGFAGTISGPPGGRSVLNIPFLLMTRKISTIDQALQLFPTTEDTGLWEHNLSKICNQIVQEVNPDVEGD